MEREGGIQEIVSNKQAAFAALIITDRRGGSQQNGRHSVSRQLRYHQDAGSYQRKPVRKNPETTEQTALLMLFSFSLTMCRPLNRGLMIVALCSDFIHQKARYAGLVFFTILWSARSSANCPTHNKHRRQANEIYCY